MPYYIKKISTAWILAVVIMLAGCSVLMQPKTMNEALAFNYATIEALSNTTSASFQAGSIDVEKAKNIRDILEQAFAITKMAETAANAGSVSDASGYLEMTSALLTQVEGML